MTKILFSLFAVVILLAVFIQVCLPIGSATVQTLRESAPVQAAGAAGLKVFPCPSTLSCRYGSYWLIDQKHPSRNGWKCYSWAEYQWKRVVTGRDVFADYWAGKTNQAAGNVSGAVVNGMKNNTNVPSIYQATCLANGGSTAACASK
jgi:hypothetical protein